MPQWMFNSFNAGRFHQVFGRASDSDEKALQSVVEFEMGGGPEDEFSQLASKLARKGINYAGLNPREAEAIDQIITIAIGPDGLWTELELESESAQGLSSKAVDELLKRAQTQQMPDDLLAALKKGRRFGVKEMIAPCNYVIFDRNEVQKIAHDVRTLVDANIPWSSPAMQSEVVDGLLMVFEYVTRKQKSIAGVLS